MLDSHSLWWVSAGWEGRSDSLAETEITFEWRILEISVQHIDF